MRSLTRKVIIWLATLLRYVKLEVVNVLIVEQEIPLNLSEMLVEPVDGANHQVSAIQVLLYLNLIQGIMRKIGNPEGNSTILSESEKFFSSENQLTSM